MSLNKLIEEYLYNYELYIKSINEDIFGSFDLQLVVYDEIEKFRDFDHPLFGYPFDERKIQINSFTMDTSFFKVLDNPFYEAEALNYGYTAQQVNFKKSYVCLESHFTNVVVEFFPSVKEFIYKTFNIPLEVQD